MNDKIKMSYDIRHRSETLSSSVHGQVLEEILARKSSRTFGHADIPQSTL